MQVFTINAENFSIESQDMQMQANSIYSFFDSILIDELEVLNKHIIYTDANALSQGKKAYFIGEQLLLGDALVIGREGLEERDATIKEEELSSLVTQEVPAFYKTVLALLTPTDVNLYRTFEVERAGEKIALNIEWVLYTFNIADERTREYFITELTKSLENGDDVVAYMQKMATLAMNAGA